MRRRAFTLIELFVVIGIISLLMGIILPAIQKVRAAADRMVCTSNLRQLGLALHHYHQDRKTLPAGLTSPLPGEKYPRMTWLTRLLPYIEQDVLWRTTVAAYDYQPNPFLNPPHIVFSYPVKLFECPSDGRVRTAQATHKNRLPALTSYVGVLGTSYDKPDGVLFLDSHIQLGQIPDGTSSTLMVGERPPSADFWYGWWYTGFGQNGTGSLDMLLGAREMNWNGPFVVGCPPGPFSFGLGKIDQQCDAFHFWSLHSGGAHFLFADGHVQFLAYDASSVLPALATRAGREAVTLPD